MTAPRPTARLALLLADLAEARKSQPSRYDLPFPASREQLSREREPWLDEAPACVVTTMHLSVDQATRRVGIQRIEPQRSDDSLMLVYLHGGGWCVGSPRTHESIVRQLATSIGCVAWSVDYALAPERAFPQGLMDCIAVIEQMSIEHPGAKIVVAGDSAGANLALAATLWLRDHEKALPAVLLLFYGVYTPRLDSGSVSAYGDGRFGLSLAAHRRYLSAYFDGSEPPPQARPYAFQLDPPCDLHGLPPCFVLAAELDILHDQNIAMADCLRKAGIDLELMLMRGMNHGFLAYGKVLPEVAEALGAASAFARRKLLADSADDRREP